MSGEYSFGSPGMFDQEGAMDWNQEASQFLWDSPQADTTTLFGDSTGEQFKEESLDRILRPDTSASAPAADVSTSASNTAANQSHKATQSLFSMPSSASDSSSHSSSSNSSARMKKQDGSKPAQAHHASGSGGKSEHSVRFGGNQYFDSLQDDYSYDDTTFPNVGEGMDNLSLNTIAPPSTQDFSFGPPTPTVAPYTTGLYSSNGKAPAPPSLRKAKTAGPEITTISPEMTIQPSKTFTIGHSKEESPDPSSLMRSLNSSPGQNFDGNSPQYADFESFDDGYGSLGLQQMGMSGLGPASASLPALSSTSKVGQQSVSDWPCRLEVDSIPDKSRVETQIPVKLTLRDPPAGMTKLHLPSHSISKPKFQAKPVFVPSPDTLELSLMLVCTSAMQHKSGAVAFAFQQAAADVIPVSRSDDKAGDGDGSDSESDPMKPLNGGPVAICQGCINRERKRAARKKTKKVEEEEEWAKDEAKRVIVCNCPEVRDWCVPGTKEKPVKEDGRGGSIDAMFVNIPMRIACYCRHHSEKMGFQVIFTIRTHDRKILAQTMSDSIMITDDHKQPAATPHPNLPWFAAAGQYQASAVYNPAQALGLNPTFSQDMPFRTSWSTNDLRLLGNTYQPQRRPPTFQRTISGGRQSQQSTATATPRNLSRPASPSSPTGHSTKKQRKSGGSSGGSRTKLPPSLTMTRIENQSPPGTSAGPGSGSASAGLSSAFSFTSPTSATFGNVMDAPSQATSVRRHQAYQSGPSTPMVSGGLSNPLYGSLVGESDPSQFYSAPTSQHGSRAPSPSSAARFGNSQRSNTQVPQQAAMALRSLPAGLNLNRPPIIQKVIPNMGSGSGGDDVTILGSGFFQGLEVMFGDNPAQSTTFWADSTLVCRTPPASTLGAVPVIFNYQHHTAPQILHELQGLLPTQSVLYHYYEDDRSQMQGLTLGVSAQQQGFGNSGMSAEDLAQSFLTGQSGFGSYQGGGSGGMNMQQHSTGAPDFNEMKQGDLEEKLMKWFEDIDVNERNYASSLDYKTPKGPPVLPMAMDRGAAVAS